MLGAITKGKVLVVSPHGDDEVLGAGGFLRRLISSGSQVKVIFVAVDGSTHYGLDSATKLDDRLAEIRQSAEYFGFEYEVLFSGAGKLERLDTVPQRQLIEAFESRLDEMRPDLILAPHGADYDQDHRACYSAIEAASRPMPPAIGKHLTPLFLTYESPKLTWAQPFHPNFYVRLTAEELEHKISGLRLYRTQWRASPHVRSEETIRASARIRGSECGTEYAEAFFSKRFVL